MCLYSFWNVDMRQILSPYSYNMLKYCGLDYIYVEYEITQSDIDFLRLHKLKLSMFELPRKCEKCSRDRFGFSNTEDLFWVVKDDGYRNTNYSVRYIDTIKLCYWCYDGGFVNHTSNIVLKYNGVHFLEKLVPLTMKQLQVIVKKHNKIVRGDKTQRHVWVFAYIELILMGFNTFAVVSKLNDDILREIRAFL